MAYTLTSTLFPLFYLTLFSTCFATICNGIFFSEQFSATKATARIEKTSHHHFYLHDTFSGKNPTSMRTIMPPNTPVGGFGFGTTVMMDGLLTEGPKISSKIVGRAQGMYALASQHDSGLLMVLNFAFVEGKYNGSGSIHGRNPLIEAVREMLVVGGTGLFRFARGYALAKTNWVNNQGTGDAIVEYNVFVLHRACLITPLNV